MSDQKVSVLTLMSGSVVDPAADLIYFVDLSLGVGGSRAITPAEFQKALAVIAAGTDPLVVGPALRWVKVGNALPYTAFQTAATTKTNTLFSLIAAGVVHAVKMKASTAFVGASISALTMKVGVGGNDKYASDYDMLAAVSATNFSLNESMGTESHTGSTAITITATATGANLSALSAGVLDVWALLSVAL